MNTCMLIPTYWTTGKDRSLTTFDHPTLVTEKGTLGRTLENFSRINMPVPVVLLPVPALRIFENRVRGIVAPFRDKLDIHIITAGDIGKMLRAMKKSGFPSSFDDVMNPDSYGRLRNWMLAYAAFRGFETIVQFDDDQTIEDPAYFRKAHDGLGKPFRGKLLHGKTGYVIDEHGDTFYNGQIKVEYPTWPKDRMFNEGVREAFSAAGRKRLSDCHVAFGGNMVIGRTMFLDVPYDQIGLTRGEDDDYVMNARYRGHVFAFDQSFWARHLPPKRKRLFWSRMRQDIVRFKYTREKVRVMGMDPERIGVFFKYFLQDDLEYKAVSAAVQGARHYMGRNRAEAVEFLNTAVAAVREPPRELREQAERQLRFMDAWARVMPKIEGSWA